MRRPAAQPIRARFQTRPIRAVKKADREPRGYTPAEARALLARLAPGRPPKAPSPPDDSYPRQWLGRRTEAGRVEFADGTVASAPAPEGAPPAAPPEGGEDQSVYPAHWFPEVRAQTGQRRVIRGND